MKIFTFISSVFFLQFGCCYASWRNIDHLYVCPHECSDYRRDLWGTGMVSNVDGRVLQLVLYQSYANYCSIKHAVTDNILLNLSPTYPMDKRHDEIELHEGHVPRASNNTNAHAADNVSVNDTSTSFIHSDLMKSPVPWCSGTVVTFDLNILE